MMLGDHGPQTTIEEDLQALGMGHLLAEADACPSSKGGDDEDEDEDEGQEEQTEGREYDDETPRTEVDVRAEDEDEEIEIDEDEFFEAVGEFMETLELDEDQVDEALESDEFVDVFIEALESSVDEEEDEDEDEDEEEKDEDEEIDDPKMEAAAEVLGFFYDGLQAMTEDDDAPSYDDLVGVIEAYECITDGVLDEASKRAGALRALRKARRKKGRLLKRGKMKKSTFKAAKRGRMMIGGHEFKAGAQARAEFRKKMRSASPRMRKALKKRLKAQQGVTAMDVKARIKGKKMAADVETQGNPISELVQNLNDLREAVQSDDSAAEELIDGLRSIYETSTTFYERIAEEVNEDETLDEEDKEDDPRVAMGRHLESIAEDSAAVAQRIAEGEADINDAADDLRALAADLDDAMEAMKGIE